MEGYFSVDCPQRELHGCSAEELLGRLEGLRGCVLRRLLLNAEAPSAGRDVDGRRQYSASRWLFVTDECVCELILGGDGFLFAQEYRQSVEITPHKGRPPMFDEPPAFVDADLPVLVGRRVLELCADEKTLRIRFEDAELNMSYDGTVWAD